MNILFNLLEENKQNNNNPWSILIWLIPIGLIILFMFISSRQRKKQQAETEAKMSRLKVGDKIKTIGLIYGEIVEVNGDSDSLVIKTGSEENPSFLTIDKMAVYQVIPDEVPAENAENADAENAENADAENAENADAEKVDSENAEPVENAEPAEDVVAETENVEGTEDSDKVNLIKK